jgi:serine/threonine protein kinase
MGEPAPAIRDTHSPSPESGTGLRGHHPLVGRVLGGSYRVEGVIDRGGMGEVLAARHLRLPRSVAIKVLALHLAGDPRLHERLAREAELISRLQHPHVVQIFDFDVTDDGRPYLVMERLTGETLEDRLQREGHVDLDTCVSVVAQIGSALASAHRAGIVHRDLKPGNVFLVAVPGEPTLVKLLDFGISKPIASGGRRLTGKHQLLGTPQYMAPEQALGEHQLIDGRTDQFALAAMVYEMLCGAHPFDADDLLDLLRRIVHEPAPPLSRLAPELDLPALDAVLLRALSKHPDDRFADIADFIRAFAEAAAARNTEHVESIVPANLGRGNQRVRALRSPAPSDDTLGPTEVFVATRLETGLSVEDVVDACGLDRTDVLRALNALVAAGIAAVESTRLGAPITATSSPRTPPRIGSG